MARITYRPFAPDDWEGVRAFLTREGEPADHAGAVLAERRAVAWLAQAGGDIAGWILTQPMRSSDGAKRGGVEDVVVAVAHRGRGVARRLMELAEEHYRAQGCAGMQLTVREGNAAAEHLYDTMGYRAVERPRAYVEGLWLAAAVTARRYPRARRSRRSCWSPSAARRRRRRGG